MSYNDTASTILIFTMGIAIGVFLAFVTVDLYGTALHDDTLDDVCYTLTDGEYTIFNEKGELFESEFHCINESHEKKVSIKTG